MSLVISLTCALLATFLQQWARRYLKITQSRYSPHKRARIRAFFSEGVDKCLLPWTVDALPTLLHISLFLFFAGLVVFLCNVNLTIFKLVLSWVGLCVALYGCITCMPVFRHDSPYYTPLSLLAWHIVTRIQLLIYQFLGWFNALVRKRYRSRHAAFYRFRRLEDSCRKSLAQGKQKTAEETALASPPEIDTRAFIWTFDCLDEDHELERFFSGLPGFRSSNVVEDPLPINAHNEWERIYGALHGLLNRTFSSDFLPAPVKDRRAMICAKAVYPESTIDALRILDTIVINYQYSGPVAIAIAKGLRECGNNMDENKILRAQLFNSGIIARMQPHDDSWYNIVSNELGIPKTFLRDYAADGDSLSLVILIHLVRLQFTHFQASHGYAFSSNLVIASNFDAINTSPKLQHEFCALWNHIVREAQDNDQSLAFHILALIRNIFLVLHEDIDSAPMQLLASVHDDDTIICDPALYPLCETPDHRCFDSTPHIHDDGASVITSYVGQYGHRIPAFVPSLASPYSPPSSTHAPLPVDETLTNGLPLDVQIPDPVSMQVIGQTTAEGRRIRTISPSPVIDYAMHGNIDPSPASHSMSRSSPSPKSNASASPPAGIAVGCTELSRTPLGDLHVLSSSSPPVLEGILPAGLLLFSSRDSI